MQKCSLCGGKVVNGRCEDCGMPIPEEHRYTLRSETVHTHEVNGEKVLHRVRQAPGKVPFYRCKEQGARPAPQGKTQRPAAPRGRGSLSPQKERKKASGWVWLFMILAVLLAMLPDLLVNLSH